MEWLGDAVLEHVITRHLFDQRQNYSPKYLKAFKQHLLTNAMFAFLVLKNDLHQFMLHNLLLNECIKTFIEEMIQKSEIFNNCVSKSSIKF